MPQIERITARGQLVRLTFSQTDIPGTATTATPIEVGGSTDGVSMPFDGEVVAVSVRSNADRTAGSCKVHAVINGTASTLLEPTLDATNVRGHYVTKPRGTLSFVAGDRVGAETVTASWTPTTADATITVWCLVYLDGI